MVHLIQRKFPTGELDPRMQGLSDIDPYLFGVRRMRNCIVSRYATIMKRWGSTFAKPLKTAAARLVPFDIPAVGNFVIELGPTNGEIWVWDVATRDVDHVAAVTSPWGTTSITNKLQFEAVGDYCYMVADGRDPMAVYRDLEGDWQADFIKNLRGGHEAAVDIKPNGVLMTRSGSGAESGAITLKSSTKYFEPDDASGVDTFWRIDGGWVVMDEFISSDEMTGFNTGLIVVGDKAFSDWCGPYRRTDRTFANTINVNVGAGAGGVVELTLTGGETWALGDIGQIVLLNDVTPPAAGAAVFVPHLLQSSTVARGTWVECDGGT